MSQRNKILKSMFKEKIDYNSCMPYSFPHLPIDKKFAKKNKKQNQKNQVPVTNFSNSVSFKQSISRHYSSTSSNSEDLSTGEHTLKHVILAPVLHFEPTLLISSSVTTKSLWGILIQKFLLNVLHLGFNTFVKLMKIYRSDCAMEHLKDKYFIHYKTHDCDVKAKK